MTASRLAAVMSYLLAHLIRGQRVLVPMIVFVLVAGVLLAGDHSTAPGPWPATTLALYPIAAWIGLVAANAEDPVTRSVTVASAGGAGIVTVATTLIAVALSGGLALIVVLLPGLISPRGFPPSALLSGGLAHLGAAAAGCGLGLVTALPLIPRIGWSFTVAALVVVITAVQPWLPPVGAAVRALSDGPGATAGLVVDLTIALTVLTAAAAASWNAARRE